MTDEYRQPPAEALDEQPGKPTEPTGRPYDGRARRDGAIEQDAREARDDRPPSSSDADQARQEQERQLETGEELPA